MKVGRIADKYSLIKRAQYLGLDILKLVSAARGLNRAGDLNALLIEAKINTNKKASTFLQRFGDNWCRLPEV